jgi:hypothetical protein
MTSGELKILMALNKLSKPYAIISGFFTPTFDTVWDLELTEVINETGLILEKGAVEDGYVELIILNAFDEGSPYSNTQVQVINSSSMHQTNLVTCQITNDDPDLILQYQSINSDSLAADSRGLGYEKEYPFSFEIRLYKA